MALKWLVENFHRTHEIIPGIKIPREPIEFINLEIQATAPMLYVEIKEKL